MGHGDLMSQAEDVADQVSSSTRETRTQSRPHRRLGPGQAAESFRRFMNPVDPLKAELKQEEVKLTLIRAVWREVRMPDCF